MHDSLRVRRRQRRGELPRNPQQLIDVQEPRVLRPRRERFALEVLYDNVERPVVEAAELVDVDQARVAHDVHRARFVEEPCGDRRLAAELRMQRLQRDAPLELLVNRLVHHAHPPAAELAHDAIRADSLAHQLQTSEVERLPLVQ